MYPTTREMNFSQNIPAEDLERYESTTLFDLLMSVPMFGEDKREIDHKIITTKVRITGNHPESIRIYNCYFKENVTIEDAKFAKGLVFENCFFDKDFMIGENVVIDQILAIPDTHCNRFIARRLEMEDCYASFTECTSITLDNVKFKGFRLEFDRLVGKLDSVTVADANLDATGDLYITNLRTERFCISGQTRKTNVHIVNLDVTVFEMESYRNEAIFQLSDVIAVPGRSDRKFFMARSYLGKAEFNNIDFGSFQFMYIASSHLIDTLFVNITWNYNIRALDLSDHHFNATHNSILEIENGKLQHLLKRTNLRMDDEVILYYTRQREIYRQLKFTMSKQGDIINEQKFHALEMEAYDRSLLWKESRWTKMILKLSRWTSDYGQSVIKPIGWLLVIHFILFAILLWNGYFTDLKFSVHPNKQGMIDGVNYYFETINPFRKTESGNSFVIIDLLMRIWASYMIYNFIRASRRFIK